MNQNRFIWYLANPFTDKNDDVMNERLKKSIDASITLLKNDIFSFSPIAYNGAWSRDSYQLPVEWAFWEVYDKTFLDHMNGLLVLQLEGWQNSVGVQAEIEYALNQNMPIIYVTMEDLNNDEMIRSIKKIESLKFSTLS